MQTISFHIDKLDSMKRYPQDLYYLGNLSLLENKTVSIVGSRKPNSYARNLTHQLASTVIYKNKLKSTRIKLNGIH